jgi:hypothetical protein
MHALIRYSLLPACLAASCVLPAWSGEPATTEADPSVAARLAARDIGYEVDADGDYKIVYSWSKEDRSQLVFVGGRTEAAGNLRIREVFAPVARIGADGLAPDVAAGLLRDNSRKILGHWATSDAHLLYVVQVPDDIDAPGLQTVIDFAAEIADDKEMELTDGRDEF